MDPRWPLTASPLEHGGSDGRKRSLEAASEGGGRPGKQLHRPGIAALLGLSEVPTESIPLPLGGIATAGSSALAGLSLVGSGGAAGPRAAMAVGSSSGIVHHEQQQPPPPPPPPPVGAGSERKWASASLTAAAALLEREPEMSPLPASALLPIPRAPPPAASLGLSAPGGSQAHMAWPQMASGLVSQDPGLRVGGGGVSGGGRLGPAVSAEGVEALFTRKGGGKERQDSAAVVGAAGLRTAGGKGNGKGRTMDVGLMGVGSGPLHRSGSSVGSSSSSSDLSGAQPSKGLSVMARTIVDGIAALPLEQRAEVMLELNRLFPQYAIPPVPSLPATALPAISAANLPGTLPDGRSQKTCTLCGQVGHNSRSRYCPKRAGGYGASSPKR